MEDYVDFETAKLLKKVGFDWCVTKYWRPTPSGRVFLNPVEQPDNINGGQYFSAPTLAMAAKWLRNEKRIALNVVAHDGGYYMWDETFLPNALEYEGYVYPDLTQYPGYEQCLSIAIKKALELITSNTKTK